MALEQILINLNNMYTFVSYFLFSRTYVCKLLYIVFQAFQPWLSVEILLTKSYNHQQENVYVGLGQRFISKHTS